MDYVESLRYLYSLADFERSGRFSERVDVAPVRALLEELGNPHLGRVTVHIAGSKGKGSVAAMVESIVRASGRRTGLFTSPHLHRFTERIQTTGKRTNGQTGIEHEEASSSIADAVLEAGKLELKPMSAQEWADGVEEVAAAVERVKGRMPDRQLVTFDVLTALGLLLFQRHEVEVQVIEVGLG